MPSYADIAHKNTSGPQPHADTALLNTTPSETTIPDVDSKVNVVPQSFKSHPTTVTSEITPIQDEIMPEEEPRRSKATTPSSRKARRGEMKDRLHETEEEGLELWEEIKDAVLRPGFLGGLVGIG